MAWRAGDIPGLTGRRVVVTGANSGIGFHTALELARHGATVILACRNAERGGEASARIRSELPDADLAPASLDLADLSSVRAFAAAQEGTVVDILVNNAGVMALPRMTTADGFEMQFGTNHLGHFALTGLLLPALRVAAAPRVVTLTSMAAWAGRIPFDDLQGERGYHRWPAYCQSKLANLMFAKELDRRVPEVTSVAAHPGYVATNLQQRAAKLEGSKIREAFYGVTNRIFARPDHKGALPSLYAATSPDVRGGECYGPGGLSQQRGLPTRVRTSPLSHDRKLAARLWEVSEDLTQVTYEVPAG